MKEVRGIITNIKEEIADIKRIVDSLKEANPNEAIDLDGCGEMYPLYKHKDAGFYMISVRGGTTIDEHAHVNSNEIFYIMKGEGEIILDGKKKPFKTGSLIEVKAGVKHKTFYKTDTLHYILAIPPLSEAV